MPVLNQPLTKDDFVTTSWIDVVNSSERKECFDYGRAFWNKAQEAQETENYRAQAVFEILSAVTSASIDPSSTDRPFSSFYNTLENLTDEQFDFLHEIAPQVTDPELQARVADVVWVMKRKFPMTQLAITAYLKSATGLESPDEWTSSCDRIERALRLALKIHHYVDIVLAHIDAVLDRYQGEDPSWLSVKLMELLQECNLGEPTKYIEVTQKAAVFAESKSNWGKARTLWGIKAVWHRREDDYDQELSASMNAAKTYEKEAEQAVISDDAQKYTRASHFMQRAVEAYRSIRGTREETVDAKAKADDAHKLLLQYQEKTYAEMIPIYYEMEDMSDLVEGSKNQVKGKNFQESLFALALITSPTNTSKLRETVKQNMREFVLNHLISDVIVNEEGKVVARQPSSITSSDTEQEDAVRFEMYQKAIYYQNTQSQVLIEPARYQINLEHNTRINDILSIILHSPFVPPQREYLFAKGLYAGLTGDFLTSTHILIPQIENSVRYLMRQRGMITSGLDDNGIQNEHNLNSTLYHPEIESIFGNDTLFDLRCLLIEHAGSNLRNRMAHGLINDGGFYSPLMSYTWWLTLRLCLLPIWVYNQQRQNSEANSDEIQEV